MNSRKSSQSIFTIFVALFVLFQFTGLTVVNGQPNQQSLASNADVICRLDPASTKTVAVTLQLNGVVFNDEGNYYPFISENHPDWDVYSTNDLYGSSHTLVPGLHPEVFWESARPDEIQIMDPSCPPSDTCKGMVGWGLYKLIITPDGGSPITININTMDGFWKDDYLEDSFYEDIFYFEVYASNSVFYVRYWQHLQGQKWTYLQDNDEVKTTDLLYLNIEQDGLRYQNPYVPFNVDQTTYTYPLAKSIANNPYINVNVHVHETMNIDAPLTIDDYQNDAPVTFWFDAGKGINILAGGYLTVSGSEYGVPDNYNVRFIPSTISKSSPYTSWNGIRTSLTTDSYFGLNLNGLNVKYARFGFRDDRNGYGNALRDVQINNSRFDSCWYGIVSYRGNFHLENTVIKGCRMRGLGCVNHIGRKSEYASDVENCVISETSLGYNVEIFRKETQHSFGRSVILKNSTIKKSLLQGIYAFQTTADVVNCVVDSNGYKFNGPQWIPSGWDSDGILGRTSDVVVHENSIAFNGGCGFRTAEFAWGYGQFKDWDKVYIPYPDNYRAGFNCFNENKYSVGVYGNTTGLGSRHASTHLVLGQHGIVYYPPYLRIYGGQNSFANSQTGFNVVARDKGIAIVHHNGWDQYTWIEETGGKVYATYRVFSSDSLNAACPVESQGVNVDSSHNYSMTDSVAIAIMARGNDDEFNAAYSIATGNIHEAITEDVALYYANALAQACLYADIAEARDTLQHYAFKPINPGDTMTAMQYVFCFALLKLDEQAARYENVLVDVDTILQRFADGSDRFAIATATMSKAIVLYFSYGDSTNQAIAKATVENLVAEYSKWDYPRQILFAMTNDTSAFTGYMPKTARPVLRSSPQPPVTVTLAQNYPNPFNPNTQITFGIPEDGEVQLTVYDIMGREVAVLASGMHQAGEYVYPFNAGNLPSGVYVYKLRFGNTVLAKQMMLTK